MKRLYSLLLALCMLLLLSLSASGADGRGVAITIDGMPLDAPEAYINEDGVTMVPLRKLSEALGFTVTWDSRTRTVSISAGPGVEEGSGTEEDSEAEEDREDSGLTVPALVVLDPGHGGSADGAVYEGAAEKELNLAIASQAARLLEEAGVTVLMTRTDDRDVGLYQRTELANSREADLFVSVHCNASLTNPAAQGIYTAAGSEHSQGWVLAEVLRQTMMDAAGAADMGTEPRPNLAVLRTAQMPAALVECGYMSTPAELERLRQPDYQLLLAQGIADGVLTYLAQSR